MGEFAASIKRSKEKVFQLQGGFAHLTSRSGALPRTPLGTPPPNPRYSLALCALAMATLRQILNTPLIDINVQLGYWIAKNLPNLHTKLHMLLIKYIFAKQQFFHQRFLGF